MGTPCWASLAAVNRKAESLLRATAYCRGTVGAAQATSPRGRQARLVLEYHAYGAQQTIACAPHTATQLERALHVGQCLCGQTLAREHIWDPRRVGRKRLSCDSSSCLRRGHNLLGTEISLAWGHRQFPPRRRRRKARLCAAAIRSHPLNRRAQCCHQA